MGSGTNPFPGSMLLNNAECTEQRSKTVDPTLPSFQVGSGHARLCLEVEL